MVTVDLSSFLPTIGSFSGAGAVGALLGYGFKKLLKVLLIVLAAFTALIGIPLGYLAYEGVITINWDKLYTLLDSATSASVSFLNPGTSCCNRCPSLRRTRGRIYSWFPERMRR